MFRAVVPRVTWIFWKLRYPDVPRARPGVDVMAGPWAFVLVLPSALMDIHLANRLLRPHVVAISKSASHSWQWFIRLVIDPLLLGNYPLRGVYEKKEKRESPKPASLNHVIAISHIVTVNDRIAPHPQVMTCSAAFVSTDQRRKKGAWLASRKKTLKNLPYAITCRKESRERLSVPR